MASGAAGEPSFPHRRRGWLLVAGLTLLWLPLPGLAAPSLPLEAGPIRPRRDCPDSIEELAQGLLRDLPGYANRVASRSQVTESTGFGTLLLAGSADLEPIDLQQRPASQLPSPAATGDSDLQQVFFTTLERRYQGQSTLNLQGFHWLFLAPGEDGWWLGPMYSSFGGYPSGSETPTPPQASRDGIIGQAVQLWLRDCRAGAVAPIETGE